MFPRLTLTFLESLRGSPPVFTTSNLLWGLGLVVAFLMGEFGLGRSLPAVERVRLFLFTTLGAVVGGRAFHVLWERPGYFAAHPLEALTRLDGLTFYGAMLAGLGCFALLLRRYPAATRARAWDVAAITAALLVGILRISCFAEGCCWGIPTAVSWAVRYYDPRSSMPWLGIPVHPVQLYESAAGFMIAGVLYFLSRRVPAYKGKLIQLFCVAYGVTRFGLEWLRGDSFRGVDLVAGLSTSQILSIAIVGVALFSLLRPLARPLTLRSAL